MQNSEQKEIESQRLSLLEKIEDHFEVPMLVLSFIWLVLMILEFTVGLSAFLAKINDLIWFLFVVDFAIRLSLAPSKKLYFRKNWITAIALALPALRLFRVFRALRILRLSSATRTLRLARVLTSLNRGITALGKSLSRRGFGYVLMLTLIVLLAGAAGILSFEKENGEILDYGTALWWTAMILTTMGSDYFPGSSEGRFLCLLLAVYGFAVFGYVTATVATFFVGRDAEDHEGEIASQTSLDLVTQQIQILNFKLDELHEKLEKLHASQKQGPR